MTDPLRARQAAIISLAMLALAATALDWNGPVRALLTYPFILVGPGVAILGIFRIRDPLLVTALVVPLSLSVQTLISTLFVYLEMYSVQLVLAVTVGVALAGLLADRRPAAPALAVDPALAPTDRP